MNAGTLAGLVPDSTYVDVAAVPWQPTRFPGVDWKILMEQKETGLSTVLMRWAPGARLPAHEHVAIEQTTCSRDRLPITPAYAGPATMSGAGPAAGTTPGPTKAASCSRFS